MFFTEIPARLARIFAQILRLEFRMNFPLTVTVLTSGQYTDSIGY